MSHDFVQSQSVADHWGYKSTCYNSTNAQLVAVVTSVVADEVVAYYAAIITVATAAVIVNVFAAVFFV